MKWTALLFAIASVCPAQEFYSSQAARLVIGQNPFTAAEWGVTADRLGAVGGVAYANDTLIVSDSNTIGATPNHQRVLIYRNISSFIPKPGALIPKNGTGCPACVGTASVVLGQSSMTSEVDYSDLPEGQIYSPTSSTLRYPTGVAYNGKTLAVADTGNNRVLIWNSLPTSNMQAADFVVGQPSFTTYKPGITASTLRGPEGVWIDPSGGLWVADKMNNRVLYYGVITQNGQAAKLVLGQPSLDYDQQATRYPYYLSKATTLLGPSGVSGDGTRIFVADTGSNRVLIWNSIPTSNGQPADLEIGQPDMTYPNWSDTDTRATPYMCEYTGTDTDGNQIYPDRCAYTLNGPRSVYVDGSRLLVADTGNDRILVYNSIPTKSAVAADLVFGQMDFIDNHSSDSGEPRRVAATDSFKTPVAIALDGTNIFVADTVNRRVVIYTPGDFALLRTAVRNAASPKTYAQGTITFGGTFETSDVLSVFIGNKYATDEYDVPITPNKYQVRTVASDSFDEIIDRMVASINAKDPYVTAFANKANKQIVLRAKEEDANGNYVTLAKETQPTTATLTMTLSGSTLDGGRDASLVAPYAIVAILGDGLADQTVPARPLTADLPTTLGGVEFYVDGIQCPLIAVAPDKIVAQLPVEIYDRTSSSGVLRVQRKNGTIQMSSAVAVNVIAENPAVYSDTTLTPNVGLAYHYSSNATATISVDGSIQAGDKATITIRDREYDYYVQGTDTLSSVRDAFITMINASDPEVEAFRAGPFQRIRLRALIPGPEGNAIPLSAAVKVGGQLILSAFNTQLCCANQAGAQVTSTNPAMPGETIVLLATGLGRVSPDAARYAMYNGMPYWGSVDNYAMEFVSSLVGGKTANVLYAGLRRGAVGVYEVHLELNSGLPTNAVTTGYIAQSYQISNTFTIPVVNASSTSN
jgi:hypothetical protein